MLKIIKIGQSAAKFPRLDNTKIMCYNNLEKGSTAIVWKGIRDKCPEMEGT